ncbi:protein-serine O-palmitoleoyltransferase porcupine-like [Onthophagus taurus]|uniref:protein-serine O-palmitoleoyltransferase porcupine-like n=1 Tax=Onthophagus taurus TaxID=166361 RepID=UPI0039BE9979
MERVEVEEIELPLEIRLKILMNREVQIIRPVYIVAVTLTGILCLGEFFYPYPSNWQECRVIMVIMAMKTISISIDDYSLKRVSYKEFLGYLFCPASVVFGPWMSHDAYMLYYVHHSKLNWKWLVKMIQIFTYAMIYMVISNCLINALIPIEGGTFLPGKWHEAFRNAFVFRGTNYFIGYLGEFTMLAAGFNAYHYYDRQQRWSYPVTRPLTVEAPRSMQTVAENWNIPTYRFLRECIYNPFFEIGPGYAILMTYLQASLLFGLKVRVMMILLNVVLLAQSQQLIQNKLARWLNCCCQPSGCRDICDHRFGFWHPITLIINGFNTVLNILHLAYLGHIMHSDFETKSIWDLYQAWDDLGIYSHVSSFVWSVTLLCMN